MRELTIKSHRREYKVFFEEGLAFLEDLKKHNAVWVVDEKVLGIYPQISSGFDPDKIISFCAREEEKTLDSAVRIQRALLERSFKKNMTFISVGGGITQDVTGFVASSLYRGVNWIYIPTTLLAQSDSCIGSKTSLNFDSFKNLIGTFYPPHEVFIGVEFIKTLNATDYYSGLGEILKIQLMNASSLGLVKIAELLHSVQENKDSPALIDLIASSLLIKKEYIEEDEFDEGRRNLLNYGHCFGHALEPVSQFTVPHGLAVVAGMLFASTISFKRGLMGEAEFNSLRDVLLANLHFEVLNIRDEFFDSENIFKAMSKDKKRTGQGLALILPNDRLELIKIQDLSHSELGQGIEDLRKTIA